MLMLVKLLKPMMTKPKRNNFFPVCFTENIWIVIKIRWKFIIGGLGLHCAKLNCLNFKSFIYSVWAVYGIVGVLFYASTQYTQLWKCFGFVCGFLIIFDWCCWKLDLPNGFCENENKIITNCVTQLKFWTERLSAWHAFRGLIIIYQFVLIILVHGHDSPVHHSPWTNLFHFQFDLINWILIKFQFLDYYFQRKLLKKGTN